MSSAVEPISVDNDSVIYEHIIPRSVRQKWMRRTSSGHLDLILTSPREHNKVKKSEQAVLNSPKSDSGSKGEEYGDSMVSHDLQNLKHNSNDIANSKSDRLIDPEEEKAVFNAFGVKLRHTGTHSTAKYIPPGLSEDIHYSMKTAIEVDAKNFEDNRYVKVNHNDSKGTEKSVNKLVKLRGNTKKPRPLSMPLIMDTVETNHQVQDDSLSMKKPRPKAYISPHAKVPWKRNIAIKDMETKTVSEKSVHKSSDKYFEQNNGKRDKGTIPTDDKTNNYDSNGRNMAKVNDIPSSKINRYSKAKSTHPENHLDCARVGLKTPDAELAASERKVSALQSVSERRKPFEKYDGAMNAKVAGDLRKQVVAVKVEHTNDKCSQHGIFNNEQNLILSESGNQVRASQITQGQNMKEIDTTTNTNQQQTITHIDNEPSQQQAQPSHDLNIANKENYSPSEESHRKLLNIFQSMPVYKPDHKSEKSIDVANKGENAVTENLGDFKSDKSTDTLTVGKGYQKKVKKIMIMTGEQRDKELKSKLTISERKNVQTGNQNEFLHNSAFHTDELSETRKSADIPVTNLDDTIPILSSNSAQDIPITNLDDLSAPKSMLNVQGKTNQTAFGPKNHGSAPSKKPGKYDADRRERVAPKIIFNTPVTGLTSALSPKGRTNRKKKLRVSFVSEDLTTVHSYPSESVAMEIYDEKHGEDNAKKSWINNSEKSIDDVIASEGNSPDFHSYMPSSFGDLTGTLERERRTIAQQNEIIAKQENKPVNTELSSFGKSNSVFTETSTEGTNAILF